MQTVAETAVATRHHFRCVPPSLTINIITFREKVIPVGVISRILVFVLKLIPVGVICCILVSINGINSIDSIRIQIKSYQVHLTRIQIKSYQVHLTKGWHLVYVRIYIRLHNFLEFYNRAPWTVHPKSCEVYVLLSNSAISGLTLLVHSYVHTSRYYWCILCCCCWCCCWCCLHIEPFLLPNISSTHATTDYWIVKCRYSRCT